jgi:hypothetical protein
MSAIDFRGAVFRGWRLLLLCAVLGTVIGYFVSAPPAHPVGAYPLGYTGTVVIGPQGKGGASVGTLFVLVKNPVVLEDAEKIAGISPAVIPPGTLATFINVQSGRRYLGGGKRNNGIRIKALAVSISQGTPSAAANLANGLAQAIDDYLNAQAFAGWQQNVKNVQAQVKSLQNQLTNIQSQLQSTPATDPSRAALQTHKSVLTTQLFAYQRRLSTLELSGAKVPGYHVLRAAAVVPVYAGNKGVASIVNHRSTKVAGGALAGLLVALLIILAVEILDKSLRNVRAVESSFDLPVICEIPSRPLLGRAETQGLAPEARLDVVTQPGSAIAEAYRRLHTAVLLEPLASELAALAGGYPNGYINGNGYGYANGNGNGYGNGNGGWRAGRAGSPAVAPPPGYPAVPSGHEPEGGNGNGFGNGNGYGNGNGDGYGNGNGRQVILMVSPGAEPTRPDVVGNLAAVFAEAGARALVVSVGNLGWRAGGVPTRPMPMQEGRIDPDDITPLAVPSQIEGVSRLTFDRFLESRGQVVTQGPAIIAAARQVADVVLIDAPGILIAHDAVALLPAVDLVVVVAQYAFTRSDQAQQTGDVLRRFRAPVLGVAFTNIPGKKRRRQKSEAGPGPGPEEPTAVEFEPTPPAPVPAGGLWL